MVVASGGYQVAGFGRMAGGAGTEPARFGGSSGERAMCGGVFVPFE